MNKINYWPFWICSSLMSGARLSIGAITSVYMLQHGCTLADIAQIKILQAAIILIFDIPTGIFADLYGKKISVTIAALFGLGSMLSYLLKPTFVGFVIAETCNAFCIAFWSGAFEGLAVDALRKHSDANISFYYARSSAFSNFAIMVMGLTGGVLAKYNSSACFVFGSISMLVTIIAILVILPKDITLPSLNSSNEARLVFQSRYTNFTKLVKNLPISLKPKFIFLFLITQILIQFIYQPILHYWQPLFKLMDKSIDYENLGTIFFMYVAAQFVFSQIFSMILRKKPEQLKWLLLSNLVLFSSGLFLISIIHDAIFGVLVFCLIQGRGASVRDILSSYFNIHVKTNNLATLLSGISFLSRIGMLISLGIISLSLITLD